MPTFTHHGGKVSTQDQHLSNCSLPAQAFHYVPFVHHPRSSCGPVPASRYVFLIAFFGVIWSFESVIRNCLIRLVACKRKESHSIGKLERQRARGCFLRLSDSKRNIRPKFLFLLFSTCASCALFPFSSCYSARL